MSQLKYTCGDKNRKQKLTKKVKNTILGMKERMQQFHLFQCVHIYKFQLCLLHVHMVRKCWFEFVFTKMN